MDAQKSATAARVVSPGVELITLFVADDVPDGASHQERQQERSLWPSHRKMPSGLSLGSTASRYRGGHRHGHQSPPISRTDPGDAALQWHGSSRAIARPARPGRGSSCGATPCRHEPLCECAHTRCRLTRSLFLLAWRRRRNPPKAVHGCRSSPTRADQVVEAAHSSKKLGRRVS